MKTLVKLCEKRNTIPILSSVAVIEGIAHATNMDILIKQPCALDDGLYHPEGLQDDIVIVNDNGHINDFPDISDKCIKGDPTFQVTFGQKEVDALRWVSIAQSTDETRYYLNGVFMTPSTTVATSGHILHGFGKENPGEEEMKKGVIVPRVAIKAILDLVIEHDSPLITATFYETGAVFKVAKTTVVSRVIDGTYPAFYRVVPEYPNATEFDVNEFLKFKKFPDTIKKIDGSSVPMMIIENGMVKTQKSICSSTIFESPVKTKIPYGVGFNANYLCGLRSGVLYYPDERLDGNPYVIKSDDCGLNVFSAIMAMRF